MRHVDGMLKYLHCLKYKLADVSAGKLTQHAGNLGPWHRKSLSSGTPSGEHFCGGHHWALQLPCKHYLPTKRASADTFVDTAYLLSLYSKTSIPVHRTQKARVYYVRGMEAYCLHFKPGREISTFQAELVAQSYHVAKICRYKTDNFNSSPIDGSP